MNKRFYVVVINFDGKVHYFEHAEVGQLDAKTGRTIKEPRGFFCSDVKHAKKFSERWQAEAVSACYDGSHVEMIR